MHYWMSIIQTHSVLQTLISQLHNLYQELHFFCRHFAAMKRLVSNTLVISYCCSALIKTVIDQMKSRTELGVQRPCRTRPTKTMLGLSWFCQWRLVNFFSFVNTICWRRDLSFSKFPKGQYRGLFAYSGSSPVFQRLKFPKTPLTLKRGCARCQVFLS